MNYTSLFYWLTVADNAKSMFMVGIIIFTAIAVISTLANLIMRGNQDEDADVARKWMKWSYPFMFLFWSLFIFTPSKKDALLIVAGGQTMNFLTTDKSAKQIPHELSSFIVTELKNMATEAKVDLNIKDQKAKILEEAKNMSAKELMDRIKVDTTFAKIVLEK
ncbi:hypothetical protein UFOVP54_127 [uncultured Caudovirales phage]|uniref:Uncharacterized protein n=1 Tax=uncultured Caudovirales phage TaxID=2100421 RepID=A0A6J5KZL8_9CAUD|nr:hypothetical protein UFOVP54_127 [uncultured Caudovirales phage]